jgi:putative MATE family efflux protein
LTGASEAGEKISSPTLPGDRAGGPDLLRGPLLRTVLHLAGPVILLQALHTAFHIADLAWVGQLGAAASGAVATCFYASWLVFAAADGLGIGIIAQVSRAIGARKPDIAGRAAAQGIMTSLTLGIGLALSATAAAPALFRLVGTPAAVTDFGVAYLRIFMWGCPALLLMIAMESVWRAAGDTVTPMWVMGGATVLNLVIDPVLIFGLGPAPRLGVEGAALASVISWIVAFVVFALLANRRRQAFPLDRRALRRPDAALIRATLAIGTPRFLVGSLFAAVYLFLSAFTARLGTVALAVLGIVNRIESLVYLVSDGTGVATATLVGQNLGAGQPDRAERATYVATATAIALSLPPSIAMLVVPEFLLDIFTPDPLVVDAGTTYLRIIGLCQIFMALEIVIANGFSGAGDTKPPLLVEIPISSLRVPLAWLVAFPLGLGLEGIAWVLSITCIVRGLWIFAWFRGGRWQRRTWAGAA